MVRRARKQTVSEEALKRARTVAGNVLNQPLSALAEAEATLRAHLREGEPTAQDAEWYDAVVRQTQRMEGVIEMAHMRHLKEEGE